MDDATMEAIDQELRKRKRKMKAQRFEAQRIEDQRFEAWRKEALKKLKRPRDASSWELAVSRSPMPLSSASSKLETSIDAPKVKPEMFDSSELQLNLEEVEPPSDTFILPAPMACDVISDQATEPYIKPLENQNQKPILEHPKDDEIKEVSIFFRPSLQLKMHQIDNLLIDMTHDPVAYFISRVYLTDHYIDRQVAAHKIRELKPDNKEDKPDCQYFLVRSTKGETSQLIDGIQYLGSMDTRWLDAKHLGPSCLASVLYRKDTDKTLLITSPTDKKEVFSNLAPTLNFGTVDQCLNTIKVQVSCFLDNIPPGSIMSYLSGSIFGHFIMRTHIGQLTSLAKTHLNDCIFNKSGGMLANHIIHMFYAGNSDLRYKKHTRKRLRKKKCWGIRDDDMTAPRTSPVVLQYGSIDKSNPFHEREDDVILAASSSIVFKRNQSSRSGLTLLKHLRQFPCALCSPSLPPFAPSGSAQE